MALDQTQNFKRVNVSGTHTSSETTISLESGEASELPDPANGEYNLVWWDKNNYPIPANDPEVEIVRVTGIDTSNDTITVQRGQENTSATAKDTSGAEYRLILSATSKMFKDIDQALEIEGGFTATQEITSLGNGESITLSRFTVPSGKKLEVYAGSVSDDAGNHSSGMEIEVFNNTDSSTEYVLENNTVQQGSPLYSGSSGDDVEIRLVNATGSTQNLTGQVLFDIVDS